MKLAYDTRDSKERWWKFRQWIFFICIQLLCQVDITERSIEHMMTYKTSHIPPTTNTHNFLISIKSHQTNLSMGKTMLTLLIQHSRKDRQTVFFCSVTIEINWGTNNFLLHMHCDTVTHHLRCSVPFYSLNVLIIRPTVRK